MICLVRSGLCTTAQLGGFITSIPEGGHLNSTSIYTTPLKFSDSSFPTTPSSPTEPEIPEDEAQEDQGVAEGDYERATEKEAQDTSTPPWELNDGGSIRSQSSREGRRKRQWDLVEGIANGLKGASDQDESRQDDNESGTGGGDTVYQVPTYTGPIHYKVPKTGYYCVGKLPLTPISCFF